jgi:polyhydroxybutyrate depolymerase
MSTAALAAAKLRMALRSTLVAWLLVLVAMALGLTVSGRWPLVVEEARGLSEHVGAARAVVVTLLCVLGLLAITWKQLAQGLAIGLTGREGLIKSSVLLRLSSLVLIGPAVYLLDRVPGARVALYDAVPWIPAVLVGLDLCVTAWIVSRLARRRLLGERALLTGAALWVATVLTVFGVLAWLLDTPHIARFFVMLLAILAVPLARPAAVPLALAWSRHRGGVAPATAAVDGGGDRFLAAVLALSSVPAGLALTLAVSFHWHNRNDGVLVSSGERREYLVHVPESYDPARPTPLVISMHGAGMWPVAQMEMSRWNEVADEHGFLVVYPSGVSGDGPRIWRMEDAREGRAGPPKDAVFIAALIDRLRASYNVDPARIYADGLSNGGGMAFVLSCTLSDRIAAVGLVASAQLLPWTWCKDPRPVPMIAFHGTDDRFAPYLGGTSPVADRDPFPAIPTWAASWARRNRCATTPVESRVAEDVTRRAYSGCADDADVVLYTIEGGGHTWPGGGPQPEWFSGRTSTGIDASRQAWEFFQAHPLR